MAIQIGHTAFFKKKSDAIKAAKKYKAKIKKTKHFIRGAGYLVYR